MDNNEKFYRVLDEMRSYKTGLSKSQYTKKENNIMQTLKEINYEQNLKWIDKFENYEEIIKRFLKRMYKNRDSFFIWCSDYKKNYKKIKNPEKMELSELLGELQKMHFSQNSTFKKEHLNALQKFNEKLSNLLNENEYPRFKNFLLMCCAKVNQIIGYSKLFLDKCKEIYIYFKPQQKLLKKFQNLRQPPPLMVTDKSTENFQDATNTILTKYNLTIYTMWEELKIKTWVENEDCSIFKGKLGYALKVSESTRKIYQKKIQQVAKCTDLAEYLGRPTENKK